MNSVWTVPGYRHIRELGTGASGRVFMGEHLESGIPVAIKYLVPELAMDPDFVVRLRDEARLLSELEDPNLVQFFEYVETSTQAAIVMELVDGVSLAHILTDGGPLTPEAALAVLKGSLLGLASAHASAIVHRDYKPGNVLVDGEGNSLLSDFGIAVCAGEEVRAAGTPAYMPPEQWSGAPATPASDVYAATAAFYECLTGQRPYQAKTLPELAAAHQSEPVPVDNVPEGLRDLVSAGLSKDVRGRPQSAFAFLLELEMTAGAVYGVDWEERGRGHIKARALALALLFPVSGPNIDVNSDVLSTSLDEPEQPADKPYRPSPRLGLVATAVGATLAMLVTGGGYLLVSASENAATAVPQAAPVTTASPAAQTGGEKPSSSSSSSSPTRAIQPVLDAPSITVTVTENPSSPTATPSKPGTPSDLPSETTSPTPQADAPGVTPSTKPKPSTTPKTPAKSPVQVKGLQVSAALQGQDMVVTVSVAGVTGTQGSTSVIVTLKVSGVSETIQIHGITGAMTKTYTRTIPTCGTGSATATGDGVTASSGTVEPPCIK